MVKEPKSVIWKLRPRQGGLAPFDVISDDVYWVIVGNMRDDVEKVTEMGIYSLLYLSMLEIKKTYGKLRTR